MFWARNSLEYFALEHEAEVNASLSMNPFLQTPLCFRYDNYFPLNFMLMASQQQQQSQQAPAAEELPKKAEEAESPKQVVKIEESEKGSEDVEGGTDHQLSLSESGISIMSMLEVITRNIGIDESRIEQKRQELLATKDPFAVQIFDCLVKKFQRLKKTKEEMVKYCMRKSFKFAADKLKKRESLTNKDYLNYYFKTEDVGESFTVPFKKNSSQKTMNSTFLSKVFNSQEFVESYKQFIDHFKSLAWKDNIKKIAAYVPVVEKCISEKSLKILDSYRRLPWTAVIINRCEDLANSLLKYRNHRGDSPVKAKPDHNNLKDKSWEDPSVFELTYARHSKEISRDLESRNRTVNLRERSKKQYKQLY